MKLETLNSELGTRNSELGTRNPEPGTSNPELFNPKPPKLRLLSPITRSKKAGGIQEKTTSLYRQTILGVSAIC